MSKWNNKQKQTQNLNRHQPISRLTNEECVLTTQVACELNENEITTYFTDTNVVQLCNSYSICFVIKYFFGVPHLATFISFFIEYVM